MADEAIFLFGLEAHEVAALQPRYRAQDELDRAYRDTEAWTRKAVVNVARSGRFSSDRTIEQYNRDIWHVDPVHVTGTDEDASSGR
jgi:glucan phosphorylase